MHKLVFLTSILLVGCSGLSQKKNYKETYSIGFYNTENLFDTINQANDDEEFLPDGKNQWTGERYVEKIKKINRVLDSMNNAILVGFCEIENRQVLQDLIDGSSERKSFEIIHQDSPDNRGIDVGMIYNPEVLKPLKSGILRFQIDTDTPNTRDILWGKFLHKKDTLFAIINHWPSRRGGEEASEPNRLRASYNATKFIDSVMNVSPKSKIIFMGDLNDYPTNNSVKAIEKRLTPMITTQSGKFGGTYNYRGDWEIMDHIFISPNSLEKGLHFIQNSEILSNDFLITKYKGDLVPKRNYAGDKYLDGYSDHLPVRVKVVFN